MKNRKTKKLTVCFAGLAVMCAVSGCAKESGDADAGANAPEEVIKIENSSEETEPEQEKSVNDAVKPNEKKSETELEGSVRSIGEDSVVVNKIFNYTDGESEIAVMSVEDTGEGAALITVYFSENTEFIVRTVKNGGVNGDADVENETGAFADLQEGKTLSMTGCYEGEDFYAEQVVIYNFL